MNKSEFCPKEPLDLLAQWIIGATFFAHHSQARVSADQNWPTGSTGGLAD